MRIWICFEVVVRWPCCGGLCYNRGRSEPPSGSGSRKECHNWSQRACYEECSGGQSRHGRPCQGDTGYMIKTSAKGNHGREQPGNLKEAPAHGSPGRERTYKAAPNEYPAPPQNSQQSRWLFHVCPGQFSQISRFPIPQFQIPDSESPHPGSEIRETPT